jgi:hypothetical protein
VKANPRRRLVKNTEVGRAAKSKEEIKYYDLKSSEDDSFPSEEEEESFMQDKKKPKPVRTAPPKNERNKAIVHTRNKGRAKVNYANMDESDSDAEMINEEVEEEK